MIFSEKNFSCNCVVYLSLFRPLPSPTTNMTRANILSGLLLDNSMTVDFLFHRRVIYFHVHSDFLMKKFYYYHLLVPKLEFFLECRLKKWTNILLHLRRVNCVRTELCFVPTMCIS